MAHSGRFKPKNTHKYDGDHTKIYYRSSWELSVCFWCDKNPQIKKWSSESIIIPYLCPIDGKRHSYYVDFYIEIEGGKTYLVEVKPKKKTKQPKNPGRVTRRYLNEVKEYAKNGAKWKYAREYALDRGWIFVVWTEDTLKSMGIMHK